MLRCPSVKNILKSRFDLFLKVILFTVLTTLALLKWKFIFLLDLLIVRHRVYNHSQSPEQICFDWVKAIQRALASSAGVYWAVLNAFQADEI